MPIYEYSCPKCQKVFEEWVNVSDCHSAVACPDCGTDSPRIMSSTSFMLQGEGWYVTDYGNRKGHAFKGESSDKGSAASKPEAPAQAAPKAASASEASKA